MKHTPPLEKGGKGGFKWKCIYLKVLRFYDKKAFRHRVFLKKYGVSVILKISPIPSLPKRGNTEKSEES